jgi:HAD superfamily hydrolase (TIGR01549 family)
MPLDISRIKALCFDVDGTLNDTDDLAVEKIEPFLRPFRFLFHNRDANHAARRLVMFVEAPGNALIGLPDWLGLDDELAKLVNYLNRRRPKKMRHFRPIAGVIEMLEQLHGHYPMAVVSARDENSTREFLKQYNLEKYFVCVAGALTVDHTKPYPDPIIWAAQQMNVQPSECLMIGDTTVDIRAGKAASAQVVGVLCGFGEEDELIRKGADLILKTTAELGNVLVKESRNAR